MKRSNETRFATLGPETVGRNNDFFGETIPVHWLCFEATFALVHWSLIKPYCFV